MFSFVASTASIDVFEWYDLLLQFCWVGLAIFGGVARYLSEYIKDEGKITISSLLAHGIVSGFSGYMMASVFMIFHPEWALIGAGLGGYLGPQGMDIIASIMKNKFGTK